MSRVQGSESETEDEHGLDEGDEAQLFQQRREGQPGEQDGGQNNALTPVPSDERHKIANQVAFRLGPPSQAVLT